MTYLTDLVRKLGLERIMRAAELVALVVVYFESRSIVSASWNDTAPAVVTTLIVLLVISESVRVGRMTSSDSLLRTGYIARFTTLGWAATGLIAALIASAASDSIGATGEAVLLWGSGLVALAVTVYAFTIGSSRISVRRYRIGETSTGTSIRITALSDLHLGEFVGTNHIRKAVELSNAQSPDVVLLLGDYVDEDGSLADEIIGELTNLQAKLGVYAVLGNHDLAASESQLLIDRVEGDPTITLLRNSSVSIEIGESGNARTLQLTGIEIQSGWWMGEADGSVRYALENDLTHSTADFRLVASHHPDIFVLCANHRADLVVSGHTHGGQLAVPFLGRWLNVGRLVAKYLWGYYEYEDAKLIVTAGVGLGVIPARLGVPPEVTVIDLTID